MNYKDEFVRLGLELKFLTEIDSRIYNRQEDMR